MTSRALAAGAVAVVVAGGAVAALALTGETTTPAAGATGERATAEITGPTSWTQEGRRHAEILRQQGPARTGRRAP